MFQPELDPSFPELEFDDPSDDDRLDPFPVWGVPELNVTLPSVLPALTGEAGSCTSIS